MLTTKADLRAAVASWIDRDDMDDAIDTCISLCEAQIVRKQETWFNDFTTTTTLEAGESSLILEGEDITAISLLDDPGAPDLIQVTHERLRWWANQYGGNTGCPRYFSYIGNQLVFVPAADVDYEFSIRMKTRLTPLTSDSDSNSMLLNAPDVYLYGTLAETAGYLADDERIPLWASRFEKAMEELRLEEDRRQWHVNTGTRRPKRAL